MMRTLILGLGNDLLRDDGVGLRAARYVAELVGDAADLAEACVATIDLLPVIAGYDRVVVLDAFMSPSDSPGTALYGTPEDLPQGFGYRSLHTLPFREMLEIGRMTDRPMPKEISIHGLCAEDTLNFGLDFSPAVDAVWREWAEEIARKEFGVEILEADLPMDTLLV